MKFVIFNPNLIHMSGHFAAWDITLAELARERGYDVHLVSHRRLPVNELHGIVLHKYFSAHMIAKPFPSHSLEGWDTFHYGSEKLTCELGDFTEMTFSVDDHVVFTSLEHNHLFGAIKWLASLKPEVTPRCTIMLQWPSGSHYDRENGKYGYNHTDVARFFKLAFRAAASLGRGVQILASGRQYSGEYSFLADMNIPMFPSINSAEQSKADLLEKSSRSCLLYAGVPALDKGFALIPEVARKICAQYPDWTFWVHADSRRMSVETQEVFSALSELRDDMPNFRYNKNLLDKDSYAALFLNNDVILVPYDPVSYKYRSSGITWDGLATASILVVPVETWLDAEVRAWDGECEVFESYSIEGIYAALSRAISTAPARRRTAVEVAKNYRQQNNLQILSRQLFDEWEPVKLGKSRQYVD